MTSHSNTEETLFHPRFKHLTSSLVSEACKNWCMPLAFMTRRWLFVFTTHLEDSFTQAFTHSLSLCFRVWMTWKSFSIPFIFITCTMFWFFIYFWAGEKWGCKVLVAVLQSCAAPLSNSTASQTQKQHFMKRRWVYCCQRHKDREREKERGRKHFFHPLGCEITAGPLKEREKDCMKATSIPTEPQTSK